MESLLELFVSVDDFCQVFLPFWERKLMQDGSKKRRRRGELSVSEIMTIIIYFHQSHYRDFKAFYTEHVCKHLRSEFSKLVSYERFVILMSSVLWPFLQQDFQLQRTITTSKTGKTRHETVYGITSLAAELASPAQLLEMLRSYWQIENRLHYPRDVTLHEDQTRFKKHSAAHNMSHH